MPWKYKDFVERDDPDLVFANVGKQLNMIGGAHWGSIKVEASDEAVEVPMVERRVAHFPRALVVWNDGDAPPFSELNALGSTWSKHTWITDHDYAHLYKQLIDALNANAIVEPGKPPQRFSPASAWSSRICMTNMRNGWSTLTLFWQS